MRRNNIGLAWESIKTAKMRNFFTMLGVIIGVASVVTTISLGEGVRRQVSRQAAEFGSDTLVVRPGNVVNRDLAGNVTGFNLQGALTTSILADKDLDAVSKTPGVAAMAPMAITNGVPSYNEQPASTTTVVGTTSNLAELLQQKLALGQFLSENDEGRYFMVIGKSVADELFKNNAPLGRSVDFRGERFIVKGVLEEVPPSPLSPGVDFNRTIFIPYTTSQLLTDNTAPIFQVFAKPQAGRDITAVQAAVTERLRQARAGQADFTVLRQEETLQLTNNTVTIITALTAAVATVSLVVGGIGIMNVMLVSVTERTHEIGVRKALGATNRQIMLQFLTEAIMLTVVGSVIGVLVAIIANVLLRFSTALTPVISPYVIAVSIGVALLIGTAFGVLPAMKAARKDAITALRNE